MDTQNQLPPPALAGLTEIAPLTNPIIISDLHLAPTKPKTIMAFVRFMKTIAPRYPELVILGDLFDYWIGDDAHPEAQPAYYRGIRGCPAGETSLSSAPGGCK